MTGGIGSGKSCVLNEFKALGADIIDADEVSHFLMMRGEAAYNKTVESFGNTILDKDGEIDRKKLAAVVFADKNKLALLNSITHTLIYAEIKRRIEGSAADVVCVEVPLLFNSENPIDFDIKITVSADTDIRIGRVMNRDGMTEKEVVERMNRQLSDSEMRRLADCVIENNGDMKALKRRVKEVYDSLLV